MQDFQPVINHGGHNARVNPHADEDADDGQNDNGLQGLVNAVHHGFFDGFPLVAEIQRHQGGADYAYEHGHMGINAIDDDADCQHDHQEQHGQQGLPQFRHSGLSYLFFSTHRFTNLSSLFISILLIANVFVQRCAFTVIW
ncbi:hypothetical protein SDC9_144896 [bioreactor metagenome]|uniref:Uncharacterized protein n=1 Tax=bioreactor metagenome TaxID=1076179 RepID=A0A645E8I7_9ZZZZ